jgi:hypothetical protein
MLLRFTIRDLLWPRRGRGASHGLVARSSKAATEMIIIAPAGEFEMGPAGTLLGT